MEADHGRTAAYGSRPASLQFRGRSLRSWQVKDSNLRSLRDGSGVRSPQRPDLRKHFVPVSAGNWSTRGGAAVEMRIARQGQMVP